MLVLFVAQVCVGMCDCVCVWVCRMCELGVDAFPLPLGLSVCVCNSTGIAPSLKPPPLDVPAQRLLSAVILTEENESGSSSFFLPLK